MSDRERERERMTKGESGWGERVVGEWRERRRERGWRARGR